MHLSQTRQMALLLPTLTLTRWMPWSRMPTGAQTVLLVSVHVRNRFHQPPRPPLTSRRRPMHRRLGSLPSPLPPPLALQLPLPSRQLPAH